MEQNLKTSKLAQRIRTSLQEPKADEFVSSVERLPALKEISESIERIDFEKFATSLISRDFWTDGFDTVGFFREQDFITSFGVNLSKRGSEDKVVSTLPLLAFKRLLTVYAAKAIEKNPENEGKIKELYMKLLDYMKNHAYNKDSLN